MRFVTMKDMLEKAKKESYAVGQYNLNTLLWAKPVLEASQEEQAPVILASSDKIVDKLGGFNVIVETIHQMMDELSIDIPVCLHLDHASTVERCKEAIQAGYSSVMIDGSTMPIEENIRLTKQVTNYAKKYGVSVEAEVGTVGGNEDGVKGNVSYASTEDCVRIVEETGIDALAAALGSVHGPYKGEPTLGFKEMDEISKAIEVPLVLHGGSGIPINQIQKSIELGHAKINVNTECAQAWTNSIRNFLLDEKNFDVYQPWLFLDEAYEAIKVTVKEKIVDFGTENKAPNS